MASRRVFLKTAALGAAAFPLLPRVGRAFSAAPQAKPPMRFIFLHRGNGLYPKVLVPPSPALSQPVDYACSARLR